MAPGAAGGAVANRIAEAVAALPAVAGTAVRVRAGIAHFPADGATAEDLLAAARGRLAGARSTRTGD